MTVNLIDTLYFKVNEIDSRNKEGNMSMEQPRLAIKKGKEKICARIVKDGEVEIYWNFMDEVNG